MHRLIYVLEPDVLSLQWILAVLPFTCLVCHFGWMVKLQNSCVVGNLESGFDPIVITAKVYIGDNALLDVPCMFAHAPSVHSSTEIWKT